MIDVFLAILSGVVFVLLWAGAVYAMAYFQHPADNRSAYFPKIVVILSFTLAATSVLMLPLDVAQRNSHVGSIPMDYLWMFVYVTLAILGIIIIPFAIFYYEAEDEKGSNQWAAAFKGLAIILAIVIVLLILGYIFLGIAEVPVNVMSTSFVPAATLPRTTPCASGTCADSARATTLPITLTFVVFVITMMCILGWLLLVIFGGIGLIAIPFDFIRSYIYRPLPISRDTYEARKIRIGEEAESLIKRGMELKSRKKGKTRKQRNEWKNQVYMLDRDYVHNEIAYKRKGGPAIFYWIKLGLGILSAIVTLLWLIQIVIWTNIKLYPFINFMFIAMDGIWQFFGTIFFALFAFYILFAVVKGNIKWGIRVPFLMTLHPMKPNDTMQNSFLVNTVLVVLSSVAVVQFLSESFSLYVRLTAINSLFNVAVRNLRGLYYYWLVMQWALPSIAILTIIYFSVRPEDKKAKLHRAAASLQT